jgi:hypothetical protein
MDAERTKEHDALVPVSAVGRAARRAVLPALLIALAAAPAASAQAPPAAPPDERAAAREMSFAAYRLRVAVLAQQDAIDDKLFNVTLEAFGDPRCDRADKAAPDDRAIDVLLTDLLLAFAPAFDPIRPALDTFLAELERIPTSDPALRGGRAGWRTEIDIIRRLPSTPDPCAALQGWQKTGFAASAAPIPLDVLINPAANAAPGKIAVAARRMRSLGVGVGAARRFTGRAMFRGVGLGLL